MAGNDYRIGGRTLAAAGAIGFALALLTGLSILDARIEAVEEAAARPFVEPLPASQEGLEQFAGAAADRCVFAGPNRRLCRWQVEGRLVRPIALGGIGDGTTVNIICELPAASSAAGVCLAHPNGESRLPSVAAAPSASDPFVSLPTIGALSHALGDIPERCTTGAGTQVCSWPITPGSIGLQGFESDAEDVRLRCLLPLDGGPRAGGSCEVVAPD